MPCMQSSMPRAAASLAGVITLLAIPAFGQLLDVQPCGDACLPIIFTHSHDGTILPSGWPERTDGCTLPGDSECSWGPACSGHGVDSANCPARTLRDSFTRTVGDFVTARLEAVTGGRPVVIANLVPRGRLDANRAEPEAAQGFPPAQAAWAAYTDAITQAVTNVTQGRCGAGLLIDMPGHGHAHNLLEMGYALSASRLSASDADMAAAPGTYANRSTVRLAADRGQAASPPLPFSTLLRDTPPHPTEGEAVSVGGMMQAAGWGTIPSPAYPDAGGGLSYFSGGYTTQRWSTRDASPPSSYPIDAMQAGLPTEARFGNDTVREAFGTAFADAVVRWVRLHHGNELVGAGACWRAPVPAPGTPSPSASPSSSPSPSASPSASPSSSPSASPSARPGNSALRGGNGGDEALTLGFGIAGGVVLVCAVAVGVWLWRSGRCSRRSAGGKRQVEQDHTTLTPLPSTLHSSPIGDRGKQQIG